MIKDLKNKVKNKVKKIILGEPKIDTYCMYAYKIVTITNEEYKCNMDYYTLLDFKSWVDFYLLKDKSVYVGGDRLINKESIKEVLFVKIMDEFTYTRVDSLSAFRGSIVGIEEAEEIRDKNDW